MRRNIDNLTYIVYIIAIITGIVLFINKVDSVASPRPSSIEEAIVQWKNEYGSGWWPWGLQSIDLNGEGVRSFLITQHNGGSKILTPVGNGWAWSDIDSSLGGLFRPWVWDFNNDGLEDIVYRDIKTKSAYLNLVNDFIALEAQYDYGYEAIRYIEDFNNDRNVDFGSDWNRWLWNGAGFTKMAYTNPLYGKLPNEVKQLVDANYGKPSNRIWFTDDDDIKTVSSFYSYWNGPSFCRFLVSRRGQLVDVTTKLGLPLDGAVVYSEDFNGDGKTDFLIVGRGYYRSTNTGYEKVTGDLTDFLSVQEAWAHQAQQVNNRVVVSNVRGRVVQIYSNTNGNMSLQDSIYSWDGEAVVIDDMNGDGILDICVGSNNTIEWR